MYKKQKYFLRILYHNNLLDTTIGEIIEYYSVVAVKNYYARYYLFQQKMKIEASYYSK